MKRLALGIALTWVVLFAFQTEKAPTVSPPETPRTVTLATLGHTVPPTTSAPTTTTQTPIAPLVGPETPCQEWVPVALAAGWPADRQTLETLMSVIWRESRCQPDAWNGHDAGLTQINQIHAAWIADLGLGDHPKAMLDPALNLEFAWRLYSSREASGKCGWTPWRLSC